MPTTYHSVTKPDLIADPSYSPDGTRIIFVEKIGSTWKISTVTTGATLIHEVLLTSSNQLAEPSFSADGNFILYAEMTGPVSGPSPYGEWALKYVEEAVMNPVTILDDGMGNLHPVWVTPTQIAFQHWQYGATPSTEFQLALIDVAGQGRVELGEGEYPRTVVS